MDETALLNIAQFCPRLQELHLSYCGKMTDDIVQGYGQRLSQLKSVHFSGPYLVTKEAWMSYFKQVGKRLESFELRYTSRFDLACVEALVESCPNLTNLKFGHITTLKSSWLDAIAKLNKLTSLELAWPDAVDAIQTQHVVDYLATAGRSLKHLSLKGGVHLDDKTFTGLSHCRNLETLHIEQASNLSAKGMVAFLKEWENPGLLELDIGRCVQFDDDVLTEIAQHSGASLTKLSIHSLDGITIKGLEHLTGTAGCNALEEINCSFVRSIDDYVLAKMVKECSTLCKVDAWGCPMVSFRGKKI
jgi:DNA repair protein RAD7